MKKILYLLSISFLMLQSCTSGDSNNNTDSNTVSDVDGNVYQTVAICNQTWIKTNLNVSKYSDGTLIPQVTDPSQWANLTTGAWCYYNNDPTNGAVYGKLYNWYAVMGIYDAASATNPALRKKLAPTGWHVPTDSEWTQLTNCLGGTSVAGGKMKSTDILWLSPNTAATNSSGFTGLPGGYRDVNGSFKWIGYNCFWWSSSEESFSYAWYRLLYYNGGSAYRASYSENVGYSVRCLKD
jgi:uncharacterized protein (TIGR02145 family)